MARLSLMLSVLETPPPSTKSEKEHLRKLSSLSSGSFACLGHVVVKVFLFASPCPEAEYTVADVGVVEIAVL